MSTKKAEMGLGGPKKKGKPSFDTRAVPSTQDAISGPQKKAELVLGDLRTIETFLTSAGVEIFLKRISPFLTDKVRASVVWPQRPTYQAETVSGEIEEHPHDESTLQTEEDKAAWAQYEAERAVADAEETEKIVRLMFARGIDYERVNLPEDESWIAEQQELEVEVPEEPLKRKRHYMETELLADEDEIKRLTLRLMVMCGRITEEVLALVEKSFRGEVEGPAAGEPEDLEGAMELRDELPEGENSEGMGGEES